jgi:DNA-binding Xre family transcriptional regulator
MMIRLRVRELAEAQGLNISQLSRKCDIDLRTMRAIWRNPERVITTVILNRLAKGLQMHPCDILDYTPDEY